MKLNDDVMNIIVNHLCNDLITYFKGGLTNEDDYEDIEINYDNDVRNKVEMIKYFFICTNTINNIDEIYINIIEVFMIENFYKKNLNYINVGKFINMDLPKCDKDAQKLIRMTDDFEYIMEYAMEDMIKQNVFYLNLIIDNTCDKYDCDIDYCELIDRDNYENDDDKDDDDVYDENHYAYGYSDSEHNITYYPSDDD